MTDKFNPTWGACKKDRGIMNYQEKWFCDSENYKSKSAWCKDCPHIKKDLTK